MTKKAKSPAAKRLTLSDFAKGLKKWQHNVECWQGEVSAKFDQVIKRMLRIESLYAGVETSLMGIARKQAATLTHGEVDAIVCAHIRGLRVPPFPDPDVVALVKQVAILTNEVRGGRPPADPDGTILTGLTKMDARVVALEASELKRMELYDARAEEFKALSSCVDNMEAWMAKRVDWERKPWWEKIFRSMP